MKKIVISLSIILAFAMFNSSAKAQTGYCDTYLGGYVLYAECDCFDHVCSGYRWYYSTILCQDHCCPGYHCGSVWDYPNLHPSVTWIEFECYTPRFGCDVGADCNAGEPLNYYEYSYYDPCVCVS
jgi:hypothetical protein